MQRRPENPLVTAAEVSPSRAGFEVAGAFNAGAIRFGEEVVLLVRVAERPADRDPHFVHAPYWDADRGSVEVLSIDRDDPDLHVEDERVFRYRGGFYLTSISHLRLARSTDGLRFVIDREPALAPSCATEAFGIEDPRITAIGGEYLITYKAVSEHGVTTALARTTDFTSFERLGTIFCPENLDVVIFPERIGGKFVAWTRPVGVHQGAPSIWLAKSDDLIHWGEHEPVMSPRPGHWDCARVGAGCVPFRVEGGWLEIYHGADSNPRYCAGAALIDAENPARVLKRSTRPILEPEAKYEKEGFFGGVVFPCGHDLRDDGTLAVYYGAADESICAAETSVGALLESLDR